MTSERPVVFSRTTILEATEQRLVLRIPRQAPSWWVAVGSAVLAVIGPALLFFLMRAEAPANWLLGVAIFAGAPFMMPWGFVQGTAFWWCRLAPLAGKVELERSKTDGFLLRVDGKVEGRSMRRGLYCLEWRGINTIILVVGSRVASLAFHFKTGASGIDWNKVGEWDRGRAELARGGSVMEETWPKRSLVPLVQAVLRTLDLGPQPEVRGEPLGGGCTDVLLFAACMFGLPALHIAAMLWLMEHPNPLLQASPIAS